MNHPRKDNRKAALAQIHIGKKQLGLDDDTYRAMLAGVTGKDSCSKMNIGELYQVIKHLEKCGFNKRPRQSRKTSGARRGQYSPRAQGQLIDVMRAVWIEMYQAGVIDDGSELALIGWAKRQSSRLNGGIGVASLEWLERDQAMAAQVLESLKQWRKRIYFQWRKADFTRVNELIVASDLKPADAILRLLAQQRIMYWGTFADFGIDDSPAYCRNRRELQHD